MKIKKIFILFLTVLLLLNVVLPTKTVYANTVTEEQIKSAISTVLLSTDSRCFESVIPQSLVTNELPIATANDVNGTKGIKIGNNFYNLKVKAMYNGMEYEFLLNSIKLDGNGTGLTITYDEFKSQSIYVNSYYDFDSVSVSLEQGQIDESSSEVVFTEPEEPEIEDKSLLESVEEGLAWMLNGVANAINSLVSWVLGRAVTIDDLVFNTYPDTKLEYFHAVGSQPADSSKLIWGENGDGKGGLYVTVNEWYSYFLQIAILAYMIMLVYMGIRIILSSTGQKMAEYKNLFIYWCLGVVILFFYPYVMKYTIELNNTFVKIVSDSKDIILEGKTIKASSVKPVTITETIDGGEEIDFNSSPYAGDGNDYMSVIAKEANSGKSLAISLTYIILTWQLITLIIHYYKRLLMTGFLITIFPLVTVSYAIDRIADGKSQSFNKWNKEFILNVFIQSFHAIVYVFVCGTVYAAGAGTSSYDFVLIITGVTFMFTGEEIIKKIFSQESPSGATTSLAETTAKVAMTAGLAKMAANTVTKVVGKDSVINKTINLGANMKASRVEARLIRNYAAPMTPPNTGYRLDGVQEEINRINNDTSMSEAEKSAARQRVREVSNAVADINNPHSRSVRELANAAQVLDRARRDPNYAHCGFILNDVNLSEDQLNELLNVKGEVAGMVAGGANKETVERHVKMRLGYILDDVDNRTRALYENMMVANMAEYGANRGFTRAGTEAEIASMQGDIEDLSNSFSNINELGILTRRQMEMRQNILEAAYDSYDDSEADANVLRDLTYSKSVFDNRNAHLYNATEQMKALKTLRDMGETNDEARAIVDSIDEDIDVSLHVLAKKVLASTTTTDAEKREARAILNEYEGAGVDLREGYEDDEVSIHEVIANTGNVAAEQAMVRDIYNARRHTNHRETTAVKSMFSEILSDRQIDIDEDGLDTTTRYYNGKTVNQINRFGFASSKLDESYIENRRRYNAHFRGDNRR